MQETAAANGVTAMPTFMFFRNKTKIDTLRGADAGSLEEKIRKWYGSDDDKEDESVVKGQVSVYCPFLLAMSSFSALVNKYVKLITMSNNRDMHW